MTSEARGELDEESMVRAMVPVSVRSAGEHGVPSNRVSAVPVDLPCGEPDPLRGLHLIREQMDGLKSRNRAAGLDALVKLAGAAPDLEIVCAGIRDGIDELLKEAAQAAPSTH